MAVGGNGYDHGFGPYQTIMTSKSRSRLERDHSKVGSSGGSPYLLTVRSLPLLQVSILYDNARSAIRNAVTPISGALPSVSKSCAVPVPPISENFQGVDCTHRSQVPPFQRRIAVSQVN